jgi:hypothetical protein
MRQQVGTVFLLTSLLLAPTLAADTGTSSASSSAVLESSTKAKKVDDPPPIAVTGVQEDGFEGTCSLRVINEGEGRKGVRGTFDAILVDATTGTTLSDLGRRKGKTNKDGVLTVSYSIPRMANFAVLAAMVVELDIAGGKKITSFDFACQLVDETI